LWMATGGLAMVFWASFTTRVPRLLYALNLRKFRLPPKTDEVLMLLCWHRSAMGTSLIELFIVIWLFGEEIG